MHPKTFLYFAALFALISPSVRGDSEYPYAVAYTKCAPWDGKAVGILLMKTKEACPPAPFPYAEVSLWRDLPTGPKKIEIKESSRSGAAVVCPEREKCDTVPAVLQVESYEENKAITGTYRLILKNGQLAEGKFNAVWCTNYRRMCG